MSISSINPFEKNNFKHKTPFKTKEGKAIYLKTINYLSRFFCLPGTADLFAVLSMNSPLTNIEFNDQLFSKPLDNTALLQASLTCSTWRIPFDILLITEDENTYKELRKLPVASELLNSENQLETIKEYTIIRSINCENFQKQLDELPQTTNYNKVEEILPENHLIELSKYIPILTNPEIIFQVSQIQDITELIELVPLIQENPNKSITITNIEEEIEHLNQELNQKLKELTISGNSIVSLINQNYPEEIKTMIQETIQNSQFKSCTNQTIPLTIDLEESEKYLKLLEHNKGEVFSKKINQNKDSILLIPKHIKKLKEALTTIDFYGGLNKYKKKFDTNQIKTSKNLIIENSKNLLIDNPHPISYNLITHKATLLTGANSGGKTTLLEHILQLITLHKLGLPAPGKISLPDYEQIYYFAKNKGSLNKGAFETMLTQLSKIKANDSTLILADEMEAVTEPDVAAKIISTTINYYVEKGSNSIFATHLGKAIPKSDNIRVDGIQAKGLDSNNNLIINHNPILGQIARSTPELIIEKMAKTKNNDFLDKLYAKL